jgi:siroheme synthase
LLAASWRASCPVLAVENVSRPHERRVTTSLAELAADPARLGLNSPAVLLFGQLAGLPVAGAVDQILDLPEVGRVYA